MSCDVSPTMTNTNTTPNDTDRTTERTRSTPRAPARALPRRALPPLSRARASVPIHPRPTGPVVFLSSRHRARTTSIVSIESTRRPTGPVVFYRRVTARAPHRSVSIESTRQSATRAFASTSRASTRVDRIRDTFSMVVSGGIHIRVYVSGILRLHYVPCVRVHASRPRVPSRPTARPRAR